MPDERVTRIGDGWYLVEDAERRWLVGVAGEPGATWVFVEGQVDRIAASDSGESRTRARKTSDGGVMAPMPATVASIHAVAGQSVKEGDTLIVLEAMKMELPIKSPRTGIVKAVHCSKGDLVQPGVSLLEIE